MKNIMKNTMRGMGKRHLFRIGALSLLLAAATMGFLYLRLPKEATFPSPHPHEQKVSVEVSWPWHTRQTLTGVRAGLTGVSIKVQAPTDKKGKLRGRMHFVLMDPSGKTVEDQVVPVSALVDFGSYTFAFPPLAGSAGTRYTVSLTVMPPDQAGGQKSAEPDTFNLYICAGTGLLDYTGAPAGRVPVVDGVYATTRIGSLYNGRASDGHVTLMLILCAISVLLLSTLTVSLMSGFHFLPENDGGGDGARPESGKE